MLRAYLLALFWTYFTTAYGQSDSFEDGNFTENPMWIGHTDYFTVNPSKQLQSNGPATTSQIQLATLSQMLVNTEWQFYINLNFDITTANYARFFLASDRADLMNFPKGYLIKFDGTSNAVEFWKQDSTKLTRLLQGKTGRASKTTANTFLIKVICDSQGKWYIFSDSTATGNNFYKEGEVIDQQFTTSLYTGFIFNHTSTRRSNFFFDDFTVREAPLSVISAESFVEGTIDVYFNKPLDSSTAITSTNYRINSYHVIKIEQLSNSHVRLYLNASLSTNKEYTLSVSNLKDKQQLPLGPLNSIAFFHRRPTMFGDVVISEILADPAPVVTLPEVEFLEILNTTSDTLALENFSISDGSTKAEFPKYFLPPYNYLIVCAATYRTQFLPYGNVLALASMPSLNNSGDSILLRNEKGTVLHHLYYSTSWYNDNDKKDGGWTLELIDPNNACADYSNWSASINSSGGTPGEINSINAHKPDMTAPKLLQAFIVSSKEMELIFDEKIDTLTLFPSQFSFDEPLSVLSCISSKKNPERIKILIDENFLHGKNYTLSIKGLGDCNGNIVPPIVVSQLVLPEEASVDDIIINELLFNPMPGGYDYVELYNRSSKYIDLKNYLLAGIDGNGEIKTHIITNTHLLLAPGEYKVLTENKSMLLQLFPFSPENSIVEISTMPSFYDDAGTVLITDYTGQHYLDRFDYDEKMHNPLLKDKEGVSLERISFFAPTNSMANWQSASSQSGYGTPGLRNSQSRQGDSGNDIWAEPRIFTPNQDGYLDYALIHYTGIETGTTGSIAIFDEEGREVIRLVKNDLLATEGFYRWDGQDNANNKVRDGVYVVLFEKVNPNGVVRKNNLAVVVATEQ